MRLTQEDKELFRQACERGNQSVKNRDGIGTLKEKTVHAVLKHYIEPREQYHEVPCGNFVADILAEDQLFATLDPTTRERKLPSGQEILLTDTVGFINKLPHHLIDAFRSTLEEAKFADLILHVVDAANEQMDQQMYTVYETLNNLGVTDKPVITVFNKQDRPGFDGMARDFRADAVVRISAKTGEGIQELLETIEAVLRQQKIFIENLYSYREAAKIQLIRKFGELKSEEYREDGIYVQAYVPVEIYENVKVSRGDS